MKFSGGDGACPRNSCSDFGGDLDSFVDPGLLSRILYHQQIGHKLTLSCASKL